MSKSVKVGIMPGRLNEFVVEEGTTIASLLELAELNPSGYEVKVDGQTVTNFESAKVTSSTNLVLLAKQVKGNAGEKTVKVGIMPGRLNEFVVSEGTSISALLGLAELNPSGYEVKVDGQTVTNLDSTTVTSSTNLVLLAKQVKGNK